MESYSDSEPSSDEELCSSPEEVEVEVEVPALPAFAGVVAPVDTGGTGVAGPECKPDPPIVLAEGASSPPMLLAVAGLSSTPDPPTVLAGVGVSSCTDSPSALD